MEKSIEIGVEITGQGTIRAGSKYPDRNNVLRAIPFPGACSDGSPEAMEVRELRRQRTAAVRHVLSVIEGQILRSFEAADKMEYPQCEPPKKAPATLPAASAKALPAPSDPPSCDPFASMCGCSG